MPQFRYRAVTHAGEIIVGEVDASSREEVVRRIEYLGHLPIDAEVAATGILNRGHRSIRKLPRSRDVSIFLRQLALLIGAGLTLEAALQTLGEDTSKALAGFANGLRASISAGESFGEALERHPSIIDPAYVAMVVAASIWLRANVDLFLGMCLFLVVGAWLVLSRREWRARIVAAIARLPGISRSGTRSTDRRAGFTLIEVVAVMLIIALVASLAVTTIPGTGRGRLKALALEAAALLRRERLGAVMTGRERQVSIDGEKRVLVGDGGDVLAIPRDVALDVLGIDALWSGRQAVVRFTPDGASTGAVLKLSREKAEYEIRVNWYTGGVAIAP